MLALLGWVRSAPVVLYLLYCKGMVATSDKLSREKWTTCTVTNDPICESLQQLVFLQESDWSLMAFAFVKKNTMIYPRLPTIHLHRPFIPRLEIAMIRASTAGTRRCDWPTWNFAGLMSSMEVSLVCTCALVTCLLDLHLPLILPLSSPEGLKLTPPLLLPPSLPDRSYPVVVW